MEHHPLFSILIAQYNNGKYFQECFDSITSQVYTNFEVIIVDDCSTDNSLDIINELIKDDPRFTLVANDENKGCGFTKRRCVELASGEICGFLDPDDTLTPNALYETLKTFEENPSIVATYSQFNVCDANLNFQKKYEKPKPMPVYNLSFLNLDLRVGHFFSFKKEYYDKTEGINPLIQSAVDQDLYLKLYEQGNFKYIPKPLYNYRVHDKGISQSDSKQKTKETFYCLILETLKRRNITKVYGKKSPTTIEEVRQLYNLPLPYKLYKKLKQYL